MAVQAQWTSFRHYDKDVRYQWYNGVFFGTQGWRYVMMQDQEDKPTHSLSKINIGLEVMWLFFVKDQGVWYNIQKF